jgi:lipoprotein LprG
MSRPRVFLAIALLFAASLAGCSKDKASGDLPNGATLVSEAAAKTKSLKSAHIKIDTEGEVSGLPVRRAEGDLLRSGDAKGSIQVSTLGILVEYQFVVLGKDIYLKGVTGGYQKIDASVAAQIYDPTAILDPDRGIAKVLSTATNPTTEAEEKVDGKDAYRVAVGLSGDAVAALVPNIQGQVSGKLWIDKNTKDLLKAVLTVPGPTSGPNANKSATVTITETNIDAPVTVSAPTS